MKRRMVLIIIGLIIAGVAVFFYIDTVFLPVQFKRFVTMRAEKYLQRQVTIGAIDFHLIKGFIVENITVSRKDDPNRPFIQVRRLTFNLLLLPFPGRNAVIIPNIKIEEPYLYISRDGNRDWNFSDLYDFGKSSRRNNLSPILLRKLTLEAGEVDYADKTLGEEFFESIQNIRFNTTLSLNKGIRFVAEAQVPKRETSVKIKGNHSLIARKLTAQILLNNIHLARYLPLAYTSQPHVHLAGGVISSADLNVAYENRSLRVQGAFIADNTDVRVGDTKQLAGAIRVPSILLTWRGKKWDALGRIELPSVRMKAASGREFQGDITADLNLLTIFGKNMTSQGNVNINNARFKIDGEKYLGGHIAAANASFSVQNDTIRLQGNFDVNKSFISLGPQTSLKGDFSTTGTQLTWSSPDSRGNRKLNVQSGLKAAAAQIALDKDTSVNGDILAEKIVLVYDHPKVAVEAKGQIDHTDIRLAAGRKFRGDPHFDVFYRYDPKDKNPVDYRGNIRLIKSHLAGIPVIEEVRDILGVITFKPGHLQTEGLAFRAQDADIQLSGHLKNFAKPSLDVIASSKRIELQKFLALFPAFKEKVKADLTGYAGVKAKYKGPLHSPADAVVEVTAQLSDMTVTHKILDGTITGVSGRLDYRNDLVVWNDIHGDYKGRSYLFSGRFNDFSRPVIDAKVAGDQLALSARIKILHDAFQLTSFTGDCLNSRFNVKGDVRLFKDAAADVDLRGTFALDLRDVGILVPRLREAVGHLKPAGILAGEGLYKGKLTDWRNWQLTFDARSDKLMLRGIAFRNVSARFAQRDLNVSKCEVSSIVYGGELKVTCSADLRNEESPFTSSILLKNLDLARLRADQKLKRQNLAGTLSLSSNLKGEVTSWRDLTGGGSLSIVNGNLWQWDILDGISSVLLIPEFKTSVFTEASADFFVGGQKVATHNARMKSNQTAMDGKGWIDFSGNLDFDITPVFSELAILRSRSIKKGPTSILTQTEGYLNIKLTGTLGDPRFRVQKFPMKIIDKTLGNTRDTLKEVIGGIVDEIF